MGPKYAMVVLACGALACEVHYQTPIVTTTGAEILTTGPTMVTTSFAGEGYADTDPRALDDFRTDLDPYGEWVDNPNWGLVWVPGIVTIGLDFRPYVTAGHWVWDGDYLWVSDYPWGAITFHYGRWIDITGVGWAWIPGRRYAGAWVEWSTYEGYLGWRPTRPTWCWRDRHPVAIHGPTPPYAFVSRDDVFAPKLYDHVLLGSRAAYLEQGSHAWTAPPVQYRYERPRVGPSPLDFGRDVTRLPAPPPDRKTIIRANELARPPMTAPQTRVTPASQPRVVPSQPLPRATQPQQSHPLPRVVTPPPSRPSPSTYSPLRRK